MNNEWEEIALLTEHSASYVISSEKIKQKWLDYIFADTYSDKKAIYNDDFKDLIGSVGKNVELLKLYVAISFDINISEAKKRGVNSEQLLFILRENLIKVANAKTFEELKDIAISELEEVRNEYKKTVNFNYSSYVRKAINTISTLRAQKIDLKEVADAVGLEYHYLSSLFHKEVGKTMSQYSTEIKMNYAIKLMKNEDYSLNEIAVIIGYDNYPSFSRRFKQIFNISPEKYLNSLKNGMI